MVPVARNESRSGQGAVRAVLAEARPVRLLGLALIAGLLLAVFLLPRVPVGAEPAAAPWVDPAIEAAMTDGPARVIVVLQAPSLPAVTAPAARVPAVAALQDRVLADLAAAGATVEGVRRTSLLPIVIVETDAAGLARLQASPLVASIELDVAVPPLDLESNQIIGASTAVTGAWAQGFRGQGMAVAVLDTGVQTNHPFFTGRITHEWCFSTNDPGTTATSLCPGGVTQATGSGAANDCDLSIAGCGHGTHVAGTAVGRDYAGGPGYDGVAPDATLISIQVFSHFSDIGICGSNPAPCALTFTNDQILALDKVLELRNAAVPVVSANMSLGGGTRVPGNCDVTHASRKVAIDALRAANVATVIAAGNNGDPDGMGAPACISTSVSVGSTTKADAISPFSNISAQTTLLAPGSSINSSVPVSTYGAKSGTSMAAPHVAGAWAVLRSKNPGASVTDLVALLQSTGTSIVDTFHTKPRINLGTATQNLPAPGPTPTPTTPGPTATPSPTPVGFGAFPAAFKSLAGGW